MDENELALLKRQVQRHDGAALANMALWGGLLHTLISVGAVNRAQALQVCEVALQILEKQSGPTTIAMREARTSVDLLANELTVFLPGDPPPP